MNVKELKEAIANLPDEMEVFCQKDAEGNGFSPLCGADPDVVCIIDGDEEEMYSMSWSAQEACMDNEDWEEIKSMPRTLVLHPVN